MKGNTPTIQEISELFIPEQFREYFEIVEITPETILLDVKKTDTPETKLFLEQFLQITKMIGIKLKINYQK